MAGTFPTRTPAGGRLHPRNRHGAPYDFGRLVRVCPELGPFVRSSPAGRDTIDFADPAAVTMLNRALLAAAYGIVGWSVPSGYLCPPVPGRADYLHYLADLLGEGAREVPRGPGVAILDVGVGANCIYPLVGASEYGWRFVGTDTDAVALAGARRTLAANPALQQLIELRPQHSATRVFAGTTTAGERFAASVCNPPFYASAAEAAAQTRRKLRQLGKGRPGPAVRNFGGRPAELWCEGGELGFVRRMIAESAQRPTLCRWFTTLVSSREHVPGIERLLVAAGAAETRIIPLAHGQKRGRIVAWRFGVVGRRTT
jgi:23S rRNA (adenine1618-N6)-methyltransferase